MFEPEISERYVKIAELVGRVADKLEDIADDIEDILEEDEADMDRLEELVLDICDTFRNCTVCPIRKECDFAVNGCDEAHNCEACPRLWICLERGGLELEWSE
jgi:hypothetical protein